MVELKWSRTALNDIKNLAEFIEKDSLVYAKYFVENLLHSIDRLRYFPESGRVVPEYSIVEVREIIYKNYRIIYRYFKNQIIILTVINSRQNL